MTKFHKKHDVIPAYLAIMAGVGLIVGSAAFAVAFGVVLVAYLLFKGRPSVTSKSQYEETEDARVLRERDEHVKRMDKRK